MSCATRHLRKRLRRCAIALALFALLASCPKLESQDEELSVRAALLFNLTKYVAWPPSQKRIVVSVVGGGAKAAVFRQLLNNKITEGRPILVIVDPSDADLRNCDVVYFYQSSRTARAASESLDGVRCLTVGDTSRFVNDGGMVGLIRGGDQIQIFVNVDATARHGITLSSRLLNLSVLVHSARRMH